ncbi:MAG: hypothetical protein ACXIVF_18660 [Rhizobiaceae bacterium]
MCGEFILLRQMQRLDLGMAGEGFFSLEHEQAFRDAAKRTQRGGPAAPICGARTRTGGVCHGLPVKGSSRCIRHCGPKAARERHERQRRALERGEISQERWARAEARRTVNRLRDQWKKNPWVPGRTIDLGKYELDFRLAVRHLHPRIDDMAPSVLDWLRWRFQRLQVDRKRDEDWLLVIRDEFPKRVLAAGQRPEARQAPQPSARQPQAASWCRSAPRELSKRTRLDQPRASAQRKQKSIRPPGRPRATVSQPKDQNDMALFVHEHRELLSKCFERCRDGEQELIVEALRAVVADPDDPGARDRWMRIVQSLIFP